MADAAVVCAGLERVGLTELRVVPYTLTHDFRSADEWFDWVLALNMPLRQLLAGVPEERVGEARRAATSVAAAYLENDGHVRFPGHGYCATATRPAP